MYKEQAPGVPVNMLSDGMSKDWEKEEHDWAIGEKGWNTADSLEILGNCGPMSNQGRASGTK